MPLEVVIVPCLEDNYAYLVHNPDLGETLVVDAPEADPILAELNIRRWSLDHILVTHHHYDHVDGIEKLRRETDATVIGNAADAERLPPLDQPVEGGGEIALLGEACAVIDVPGHTVGHVAYHFPGSELVFTGDSLMVLGCGRLFEGTPAQMLDSLMKLAALPDRTKVYSGHEYGLANARFALSVEPDNPFLQRKAKKLEKLREEGLPTVPSTIEEEALTNPFLRVRLPQIRKAVGMSEDADPVEVFAELRRMKDIFRG